MAVVCRVEEVLAVFDEDEANNLRSEVQASDGAVVARRDELAGILQTKRERADFARMRLENSLSVLKGSLERETCFSLGPDALL